MSTRTRKALHDEHESLYETPHLELDLESVSDDEIESMLFEEETEPSKGFLNLPTMAGLSLILVGVVYLFQELGIYNGFDISWWVQTLPWLAGILIILLGFGVLSWRPKPKQKKVRKKAGLNRSKTAYAETTAKPGKKRLTKSRNKKIAGVAAGIAEHFNIDPTVIRIAWVISIFMTNGLSILFYLAMAYILPPAETISLEERITIIRDS